MNEKPPSAPESLPDRPQPRFIESGGPLRLEDACCVLRHDLGEAFDIGAFLAPDDKTNP